MTAANSGIARRGGIDLGGTKIEAVVVDAKHNVLGSARRQTPTTGTPAGVAAQMALAVREAARLAGSAPPTLIGVGVGSPGVIDPETGTVSSARHLPGRGGTCELASALEED